MAFISRILMYIYCFIIIIIIIVVVVVVVYFLFAAAGIVEGPPIHIHAVIAFPCAQSRLFLLV